MSSFNKVISQNVIGENLGKEARSLVGGEQWK